MTKCVKASQFAEPSMFSKNFYGSLPDTDVKFRPFLANVI